MSMPGFYQFLLGLWLACATWASPSPFRSDLRPATPGDSAPPKLLLDFGLMGGTVPPADIDTSIDHPFGSVNLTGHPTWGVTFRENVPVWIHESRWHTARTNSTGSEDDNKSLSTRNEFERIQLWLQTSGLHGGNICPSEHSWYGGLTTCLAMSFRMKYVSK